MLKEWCMHRKWVALDLLVHVTYTCILIYILYMQQPVALFWYCIKFRSDFELVPFFKKQWWKGVFIICMFFKEWCPFKNPKGREDRSRDKLALMYCVGIPLFSIFSVNRFSLWRDYSCKVIQIFFCFFSYLNTPDFHYEILACNF